MLAISTFFTQSVVVAVAYLSFRVRSEPEAQKPLSHDDRPVQKLPCTETYSHLLTRAIVTILLGLFLRYYTVSRPVYFVSDNHENYVSINVPVSTSFYFSASACHPLRASKDYLSVTSYTIITPCALL